MKRIAGYLVLVLALGVLGAFLADPQENWSEIRRGFADGYGAVAPSDPRADTL